MSANTTESLHFYNYLCQTIGSEKEVKVRRLTFLAYDTSHCCQISSGSKSEGMDLKGSDIDIMLNDSHFIVYESVRDVVHGERVVLIMDTTETHPCFTHLRLHTNYNRLDRNYQKFLEQRGMTYLISSGSFKQYWLQFYEKLVGLDKIHGPCLSDDKENYDLALSLQCDKWISQAVPWINRPRSSWLSPETISKITMSGTFFVPIGLKNSINEDLEWRISFSVAEKFLIFAFNHTQFLCYALLKVVLKEIIERDDTFKGLLCSYYLKTLMFWISDDLDPTVWRPDNIIECFSACLQRLLYSVEYTTLLHYFISDFNFLDLRLRTEIEKKKKLTYLLFSLYQQGVQCLAASETMHNYSRFSIYTHTIKESNETSKLVHVVLQILASLPILFFERSVPKLFNRLLHNCKTDLSHNVFIFFMAKAHQIVPQKSRTQQKPINKQLYHKYNHDLSNLMIGLQSDSVSGWLMMSSFCYIHENYLTALDLINYTLSKITDEKCLNPFSKQTIVTFTPKQQSALDMMKKEKLITILKLLTVDNLCFQFKSDLVPKELQHDVLEGNNFFDPLIFAHFLRFLCFYHLHDRFSYINALKHLFRAIEMKLTVGKLVSTVSFRTSKSFAIAAQMMGETELAIEFFKNILNMTR